MKSREYEEDSYLDLREMEMTAQSFLDVCDIFDLNSIVLATVGTRYLGDSANRNLLSTISIR